MVLGVPGRPYNLQKGYSILASTLVPPHFWRLPLQFFYSIEEASAMILEYRFSSIAQNPTTFVAKPKTLPPQSRDFEFEYHAACFLLAPLQWRLHWEHTAQAPCV